MKRIFTISLLAFLTLTFSSFADSPFLQNQETALLISAKAVYLNQTITETEKKINEISAKIEKIEKNQEQNQSQPEIK